MGTIFKYNNQLIQCQNLQKKLRKLKISESDIEIIKDGIPNEILEKEFVNMTKSPENISEDMMWIYYVYQNSKGNYLWNINIQNLDYIANFGLDVSDYKLVDICKGNLKSEYYKWNPETKTGIKWKI